MNNLRSEKMKHINEYQVLITELLKREIDFKVSNREGVINFYGDIYVYVEESRFEEKAIAYSVGARFRERDFELQEISGVVDYIEEMMEVARSEEVNN